jgi:hypothetical protein
MDLRPIINEISSQTEGFLADATTRELGRAGIAEFITAEYPHVSAEDRKKVIEGVMALLEYDDFFGTQYATGAFDEEPESDSST